VRGRWWSDLCLECQAVAGAASACTAAVVRELHCGGAQVVRELQCAVAQVHSHLGLGSGA
jgi:hypothetical protein